MVLHRRRTRPSVRGDIEVRPALLGRLQNSNGQETKNVQHDLVQDIVDRPTTLRRVQDRINPSIQP